MFKIKFKALSLGIAIACASQVANANIQSQMDKMFEGMSNSTDAGAYETATRGVITGGSMRLRNKIVNAPVVAFRPPSFQAGCGGIDMFAGSFSFINAQQFVQSLRSIASNAVGVASGYAFKLALQAMGPTVANVIKDLQEAMQHINGLMSNSCQLATGLVTDTFMAFGAKLDAADKQKSFTKGIKDNFGSWFNTEGKSAGEEVESNGHAEMCKDKGNVVWCNLRRSNAKNAFLYGSLETDEIMMSFTGSVILGEFGDSADGKGRQRQTIVLPPLKIDLETMIEGKKGEKVSIYDCGGDEDTCYPDNGSSLGTKEIEFDGVAEKIVKAFVGSANSSGIIQKWATNTGTFTEDEKSLLAGLQQTGFSAMIQRLSKSSPYQAKGFVQEHSKMLARDMTYQLARGYIEAVRNSLVGNEMEGALGASPNEFLRDAYTRLDNQYQAAIAKYGTPSEMNRAYKTAMELLPAPALTTAFNTKTTITGTN
ncbi:conjugal transfer protein TraH [Pseudomonas aeruginosa]